MPWLNSCCGISLKIGTIITGLLGMIIGLATLIFIFVSNTPIKTIVIIELSQETVRIIVALNLVMTIVISTLLIIGAITRKRFFMIPWIVLAIMIAVGLYISVIYTAVVSFFMKSNTLGGIIWLLLGHISLAIYVFLWVVVVSYYQLVEMERNKGPYSMSPYGQRR